MSAEVAAAAKLTDTAFSFRFITNDGVSRLSSSLRQFLLPYDTGLWLGISSAVLALSICTTAAVTWTSFPRAAVMSLLRVLAPLAEQFADPDSANNNGPINRAVGLSMTT